MDTRGLSSASTVILSAFIPYVWHGNLPVTGDRAVWEGAAALWQALRPSLETDSGAVASPVHPLEQGRTRASVVKSAVEQPTETSLKELNGLLARLFEESPDLTARVGAILVGGPFDATLSALSDDDSPPSLVGQLNRLGQQIQAMRGRAAAAPVATSIAPPRCQVCGRSDSSLRVVGYPYVASVLIMTFRRTFAGIWCGRHAAWYRTLAGMITVTIGWLGFPFGLLYTPAALLTLARGGNQPPDVNQRMLMDLAQHKVKDGQPAEALRCLEAALSFGRTPALEARLRELYALNPAAARRGGQPRLIVFPLVLAAAAGIGALVGISDYFMGRLFSLLGDSVPLVIAVMTWVPLLAALFAAGVLVTQLVESALIRTHTRQRPLGRALAILAALVTIYAVPGGDTIAAVMFGDTARQTFSSLLTAVIRLSLALVWGGADVVQGTISKGTASNVIYLLILLGSGALYVVSMWSAANAAGSRLRQADDLRAVDSSAPAQWAVTGWLALVGCVVVAAILFPLTQFVSNFIYASPATLDAFTRSVALADKGEDEQARTLLEQARTRDPGSFVPPMGLSLVELQEGHCDEALKDIQAAAQLAPAEFGVTVESYSGEAYMCMYRTDDAIAAYEKGVAQTPSSRDSLAKLGLLYYTTGDFAKAQSYLVKSKAVDPTWAVPYVGLAMIDYVTDQPDREQTDLKAALSQKLDERAEVSMLAAYYAQKDDFPKSEKYLRDSLALTPNYPDTMAQLSGILIAEHQYDEAASLADHILAGKSDPLPALIAKERILLEHEDPDGALGQIEQAEALRPGDMGLHAERAWIYYLKKDYQKALSEAALNLATDKYNAGTLTTQALSYQALGRQEDARAAAEKAMKIQPKRDLAYYVLGVYFLAQGDRASARKHFQAFLALTWDRAYVRDLVPLAKDHLAGLGTP